MSKRIIIIGGGIIGSSLALFLHNTGWRGQIVLVEPDPSYANSSTGRSASAIRQQFNLGINTALSNFSFGFLKNVNSHLSVSGEQVEIDLVEKGYLVLFGSEGIERAHKAWQQQTANGAEISLLEPDALQKRFPWLHLEGVGAACYGERGEGWFDPNKLMQALRRKVESLGVKYLQASVEALSLVGDHIDHAHLSDGSRLEGDVFVNATGAKAAKIAAMAGISAPLESRKRTAFVFSAAQPPEDFCALIEPTFGATGIFARPYQGQFMAVTAPHPSQDPDTDNLEPDLHLFEAVIRPSLGRRVRGFEQLTLLRAWAGHYEMNTFDQNAILGFHPDVCNFVFACGLSGHGIMHAPAIGRGLAELLVYGKYQHLDLSAFAFGRTERLDDTQASEFRKVKAGV
jgi:FAD-dependent oxidoreductase domain-containing protein 1